MSAGEPHLYLLLGGCLTLIGLGISAVLVSRQQTATERRSKRLERILAPHIRITQIELSAFTLQEVKDPRSARSTLGALFGYNPERAAIYPVPWFVVLPVTFVAAFGVRYAARDMLGMLSWLTVPLAWIFFSRWFFNRVEAKRRGALLTQFPDALAMIVRSIRVGVPVIDAVRNVSLAAPSPTSTEFARMVEQISLGTPLDEAVTELAARSGLAEYRFFGTALALQTQTGGTLSETLENLADVIRKRAALKARGHAMTAEARTSSAILAGLPFVVGFMLWVINPPYIMLLFDDPTGKKFLSTAVIFLALGMFSIKAIIKKVLP
jgi:tight adherence protein B